MTYDTLKIRSQAIDYSSQGIVITDPNQPDNPIVDVNKAFTTMTGYSREDIVGKNCRFLQANHRDQASVKELKQAIASQESKTVLLRNYRKDGTMFWNELSVSPVLDDDGLLINFVGVQQDVTKRETMTNELEQTNTDLKALNKLMVDRELKMIELKEELQKLKKAQ